MKTLFRICSIVMILTSMTNLSVSAQIKTVRNEISFKEILQQPLDQREISSQGISLPKMMHAPAASTSQNLMNDEEPEFLFDPKGEEKMYVMSLYSYSQTNGSFSHAESLKSQVRFDSDGKTVYFKDITRSLNVLTWLKGTIDGDTIRIPFGQPLAYYRSQYLIFFAPMLFEDKTGALTALEEFKLVIKGDSLASPTYPEGTFQAACGYVYINQNTQGKLSLDLDHGMRALNQKLVEAPEGLENEVHVYSYLTSRGNLFKRKVNMKRQGNDLYLQLSTCAPNAYVKATIEGTSGKNVRVESPQLITDSTFIYFYSLADPIYNEEIGELVDFTPATEGCRLYWNEETHELSSDKDLISVDYIDGMEYCMDYILNPSMKPYAGDVPAKPIAPFISKVAIDEDITFKYVCFYLSALDVDSNYINVDNISYRVYLNDTILNFTPASYGSIKSETTEIPYFHADNFDFYVYGEQHYVYLYGSKIESVGIQSIYTVNGQQYCSDISTYRKEPEPDIDPTKAIYDMSLVSCRVKNRMLKSGEKVEVTGTVSNLGQSIVNGYTLSCTYNGVTQKKSITSSVSPSKGNDFSFTIDPGELSATNNLPVKLHLELAKETDEVLQNNDTTLYFSIYEEAWRKNAVLLEEFTSESCGWCPFGAYKIETAINESNLNDSIIWICHHQGYAVDWLTIAASGEYCDLYGGNSFAPAMMLDRDVNLSDEAHPVFSIPGVDEVKTLIRQALDQPCFVDVDVKSLYTAPSASIDVTVKAAPSFEGQSNQAYMTLILVEDHIKAKRQKSYDDHTITYHHNAIRSVLTPTWGTPLEKKEQQSFHFDYEVPENYDLNQLKLIAFVHDGSLDVNCRSIFNTALCFLWQDASGIESLPVASHTDRCYNLQGQLQASPSGLHICGGKLRMIR